MRDCLRGWKRDWEEERLVKRMRDWLENGRLVIRMEDGLGGQEDGWKDGRLVGRMKDWLEG